MKTIKDIYIDIEALKVDNLQRYKREQDYLQALSNGQLYINAPVGYMLTRFDNPYRRDDLARCWADSPTNRQARRKRLYWLQKECWETGIYWSYRVLVFFKFEEDDLAGMTLYRLDSKSFPGLKYEGTETIELDPEGNQIIIADPLPGALTYNKAEFWRGFDYIHAHHGRTPKEVKAAKQRREQFQKKIRQINR